jgi:hypothetical protein
VVVSGLLIAVIMYFTVQTQLPPKVFNWHDDFEKYFAHPVRMLQTGTLFGSPLSALGSETFGGQAVLHGIVLNHFPIPYINGVDAVFGLLLCLLIPISMFPMRTAFLPISLISMLVVFFINPQYVNVSALYIGSAFMMTSILLLCDSDEHENKKTENLPPPVLLGLIYAGLIAVKTTFIVFPLLHMSFFIVTLVVSDAAIRYLVRWSAFTVILTFLFLLPWILLHLPHYVLFSLAKTAHSTITASNEHLNLLSSKPLFYGASFAHYTFIGIAPAICVLGLILWKRKEYTYSKATVPAGLAASGATIFIAYLLIIIVGGPILRGYEITLRFTIPLLIAGAPIILSLVYFWALRDKSSGFKLSFSTMPLLFGVLILISFSQSLTARIHQAYESGSILAISRLAANPYYIKYNEEVIYGDTKLRVTAAQKQIPPGQAAVIRVSTPFYLDYKRNIIFDAEPAGIASPWAYIPDVDYFLVEYSGLAIRSFHESLKTTQYSGRHKQYIAERYIAFLQSLQAIKQNADELYNDGKIVVFKKHRK